MRLGRLTNGISCEFKMQDDMKLWLSGLGYTFEVEYRVREVSRVADFLAIRASKGLINIEAKCMDFECMDFECMMKQLDDHAQYCDYSFAYIPDYAPTPKWFKEDLTKKGYGLIVYNYSGGTITEALESHVNTVKYRDLRSRIIHQIINKKRNETG